MEIDLTIVIPALNEANNLRSALPRLVAEVRQLVGRYEILVVDGGSTDSTRDVVEQHGARYVRQAGMGYGDALVTGIRQAAGKYILTMDADLSHDPAFVSDMWAARSAADVVIASRYVEGGSAEMGMLRRVLSRVLNIVFRRALSLRVRDLSSGYRLYKASVVKGMALQGADFDVLEEILLCAYAEGWSVTEIPFHYAPRAHGGSHAKLLKLGVSYLRTLVQMWRLRNSIQCADYDARAYDSIIPLQRWWQRSRYREVCGSAGTQGRCLDIGCGSSRILGGLGDVVGLDLQLRKLRYCRAYHVPLVQGSVWALPFRDRAFDRVVCSQVIEHLVAGEQPFLEMARVLKEGGTLVLGTPDYGRVSWRAIEALYRIAAPNGYADEHITHYTKDRLIKLMAKRGFVHEQTRYVVGSEMVLRFAKRAGDMAARIPAGAVGSNLAGRGEDGTVASSSGQQAGGSIPAVQVPGMEDRFLELGTG